MNTVHPGDESTVNIRGIWEKTEAKEHVHLKSSSWSGQEPAQNYLIMVFTNKSG